MGIQESTLVIGPDDEISVMALAEPAETEGWRVVSSSTREMVFEVRKSLSFALGTRVTVQALPYQVRVVADSPDALSSRRDLHLIDLVRSWLLQQLDDGGT